MSRDSFTGSPPAVPTLPEPAVAARAYAEVEPELLALAPHEIRPISVDLPYAVTIALGAVPRLAALRGEIVTRLPSTPIARVDALETYAFAAYYAHLLTLPSPTEATQKQALLEEAKPLRADLLVAAEALAARRLVDRDLVAKIRSGQGNVDIAGDLIALAALFTTAWPSIEDRTAVTIDEVHRAGNLGPSLLVALSREAPKAAAGTSPVERRARAFTALLRAYAECRRAVEYLRYHDGDADAIAPSLFTRAKRAKRAADGEAESVFEGTEPVAE